MSLRQIEVNKCEDCPFINVDSSDPRSTASYYCRATEIWDDIEDDETTPDWCPLLKDDYIQVSHIDR